MTLMYGCLLRVPLKLVEHIRDSLSADYPDKKATFEQNAAAYIEKLQALDKAYTEGQD